MGQVFRFPLQDGATVEIDPAVLARANGLYEAAFRRELELLGALELAARFARAEGADVSASHVQQAVRALIGPRQAAIFSRPANAPLR